MTYKLKLEIFEGPLDLLLYLIKKNDIDITNIPIAEVTEQYMEYIEMLKILDLDLVGDFLVMAATLMHIKSKMLLPPDPAEVETEEEDPRDELVRRLLEYKKFKEVATILHDKEVQHRDYFTRLTDELAAQQLKDDAREILFEATLFDLINAFSEALKRTPEEIIHEITREEYTVEQKVHDILHRLLNEAKILLHEIFAKAQSKVEVIVIFLAVLELIRLKEIKAVQHSAFGEIEIYRNKDNMVPAQSANESGDSANSGDENVQAQPESSQELKDQ